MISGSWDTTRTVGRSKPRALAQPCAGFPFHDDILKNIIMGKPGGRHGGGVERVGGVERLVGEIDGIPSTPFETELLMGFTCRAGVRDPRNL